MPDPDFLIIGAGSAGCVLARRLADAGQTVALIEAGPPDYSFDYRIHMPAALSQVLGSTTYNWSYMSEPEPHLDGRRMFCPRGKTLGGSSSINGMIWVRGHRSDFDRWASLSGFADWNFAGCAPFFERAEAVQFDAEAVRGRSGPMKISRGTMDNPLTRAFLEAGVEAGHASSADLNGEQQEGVGPLDRTILDGRRFSTSRGYLQGVRHHPKLTMLTRARVTRLLLSGLRVTGAEIQRHGNPEKIVAGEVILCAGAIDSPKILMLSGIGDPAALTRVGIEPIQALRDVGQHLSDHLEVYIQQACTRPVSLFPALKWYNKAWIGPLWYLAKRGPGSSNHFEAGAFIRSSEAEPYPDLQLHFLPVAMNYDGTSHAGQHGFQVHVGPMKPTSRGSVTLRDSNPDSLPQMTFNYASTEKDRAVMRAGIRAVRDIIAQPVFDEFRGPELEPSADITTDEELDAFVRRSGESAYHPCGTCRMGSDRDSVVDRQGRVHGIEGLRVVDASIMPEITNGNLNAPVIMLAEKIAGSILSQGRAQ